MPRIEIDFGAMVVLVVVLQAWSGQGAGRRRGINYASDHRRPSQRSCPFPPIVSFPRRLEEQDRGRAQARRAGSAGLAAQCPIASGRGRSAGEDSHPACAWRRYVAARGHRLDGQGLLSVSRQVRRRWTGCGFRADSSALAGLRDIYFSVALTSCKFIPVDTKPSRRARNRDRRSNIWFTIDRITMRVCNIASGELSPEEFPRRISL